MIISRDCEIAGNGREDGTQERTTVAVRERLCAPQNMIICRDGLVFGQRGLLPVEETEDNCAESAGLVTYLGMFHMLLLR